MELKRKSGILLHISSLPSAFGIGDLGPEAYGFIDLLVDNGLSLWQILPLGPNGPGNSPYQSYSAYAGDKLYISPSTLINWGLLNDLDVEKTPIFNNKTIDFKTVSKWKGKLIEKAWKNFKLKADSNFMNEFNFFKTEHDWWLTDYTLYTVLHKQFGNTAWNKWPDSIANRNQEAIEKKKIELNAEMEFEKFTQFLFFRQWFQLKNYANERGIEIFGDLPLYVSYDSSDVWANQDIFLLDKNGEPSLVGGVPPDYFSEDGQLWGNPVYNWEKLSETNFQWWIARIYFNLHLYNLVRIDHFRGLESFWAIPADSETAKNGEWLPAKGKELLQRLKAQIGELKIIAEDLGVITTQVEELRDMFNLPGMKVLQFAFASDATNTHLPHNYSGRNVVYTGTHDNNTLKGWWNSLQQNEKSQVKNYISLKRQTITQQIIEYVWSSSSEIAIIPMQDLLDLDGNARMNTPGTSDGNWRWRYDKKQIRKKHLQFIKNLNILYNRYNDKNI